MPRRHRLRSLGTGGLISLAVAGSASPARAMGPVKVELAAEAGAATSPSDQAFSGTTPFGFGFGARIGVSWEEVYLGATASYYLGAHQDAAGPYSGTSVHTVTEGLEAGYTFTLPVLALRPQVGFGTAGITTDYPGDFSNTQNNLYVLPALAVLVPIGTFFVGGTAGVMVLPSFVESAPGASGGLVASSHTYASFVGHIDAGVRF